MKRSTAPILAALALAVFGCAQLAPVLQAGDRVSRAWETFKVEYAAIGGNLDGTWTVTPEERPLVLIALARTQEQMGGDLMPYMPVRLAGIVRNICLDPDVVQSGGDAVVCDEMTGGEAQE